MIINNAKKPLNPPVLTVKILDTTRALFGALLFFSILQIHTVHIFQKYLEYVFLKLFLLLIKVNLATFKIHIELLMARQTPCCMEIIIHSLALFSRKSTEFY